MTTEGAAGRTGRFLERLAATVDFRPIEEELQKLYPTKMGRPSHPPLVLFKMLLLEHCYNLSDPEVEAQVIIAKRDQVLVRNAGMVAQFPAFNPFA